MNTTTTTTTTEPTMHTFLPIHTGRAFYLQPQTASILEMEEEFGVTYTAGPAHATEAAARAWAATNHPGSTVLPEHPRHWLTMKNYDLMSDSEGYYCRPHAQPADCELFEGPYDTIEEAKEHAREEGWG